ncbi:hypothetical protein L356_08650 [Enterobacter sp. MGH 10]|uniref:Uncharacterized protein n=1 Tax=Enterobacter hormaechei TaxID=158836 RepID=A0A822XBN6_9ENTR|nr:hypothetical protein L361_01963 [Enterobacter sp. MGH 15]EUM74360.1 hypothetical protein L356_08650 [Enterobacter sp. MGH 10]EUM92166.1 hypothetical protein L352_05731 [Enterobacter sp. MGH 6]EUN10508.1 hypothetical protein L347_05160 [Enterobacter sp. MGH 1]KZR21641.1 hypothetical protein A3N53_04775 [Enterobacter hormaechei subsp. steigerwaltii]CAA2935956.1 Uncharacterised protein [Enterobacter cloacae]CZW55861.1 Uncharacterised protein [Enterobacter hormaechei]
MLNSNFKFINILNNMIRGQNKQQWIIAVTFFYFFRKKSSKSNCWSCIFTYGFKNNTIDINFSVSQLLSNNKSMLFITNNNWCGMFNFFQTGKGVLK